ncbi:hypothetical protein NX722_28355 [Endozoicomonas gorgoniicola]|uniref:Uncharacterized protein n=1 Tax=Endozoicomonas gorgoniicola TaxID=1234144 RepID=A0ABT3MPV1_9GAMM|nr:hypothetical protein [Endozoicomonas gorgoniicola]MCW7551069.1 hypothetical protein [Endozoicomonas gorgoniicola]MCW7556479.1 hypothetical protein [Endozoicomonas gorgoniicola]
MKGAIYEVDSGRLEMIITAPRKEDIDLQLTGRTGFRAYYGDVKDGQYIVEGSPVLRPVMGLTVSSTELTIAKVLRVDNIPKGTKVFHPEGEVVVDDGFIEWYSVEPGTYLFRFENFPYMEEEINAVVR